LLNSLGEAHGGDLGAMLAHVGRVQEKIAACRDAALAAAQERLLATVTRLLEVDLRAVRERKMRLYRARAELERAAARVHHYRRKMRSGHVGQERKMEGALRALVTAEAEFSALNIEVMRALLSLEVRCGATLLAEGATHLAAEQSCLSDARAALDALAQPLATFAARFQPARQAVTWNVSASEGLWLAAQIGSVLPEVSGSAGVGAAAPGVREDEALVALCRGSPILAPLAASPEALAALRAQLPVAGIASGPAPAPGRQLCTTSGGNTRPPVGAGAELFGVGLEELAARRPGVPSDGGAEADLLGLAEHFDTGADEANGRTDTCMYGTVPWVLNVLCSALEARGGGNLDMFRAAPPYQAAERVGAALCLWPELELHDSHVTSPELVGAIKVFLRRLPEPLLPSRCAEALMALARDLDSRLPAQHPRALHAFLSVLPPRNAASLLRLTAALARVRPAGTPKHQRGPTRSSRPDISEPLALALAPALSRAPIPAQDVGTNDSWGGGAEGSSVEAIAAHTEAVARLLAALIRVTSHLPLCEAPTSLANGRGAFREQHSWLQALHRGSDVALGCLRVSRPGRR